jgi:hypothetical protein
MAARGESRRRPTVVNVVAAYVLILCGGFLSFTGFSTGNAVSGVVGLLQIGLGAYSAWWAARERRRLR